MPAAGFAQDGPVPDAQGQRGAQGQPGSVLAEGADVHRDGRRADVQGDVPGQVADRLAGDTDVDPVGEQPAVRRQQHLPPPQLSGERAVHVDRDPRHPADGPPVLLQALEPAHPQRLRDGPAHQPVSDAQGARAERAGHDGAVAAHGEGAVEPQPYVGVGGRYGQCAG
ncbi:MULTISPECIES: hypothetical protein [unclassified Streptomyces]|uniref:hypothetical protein n=1 Tax=unclassified Streptomyces TaxID=2593676 RepID=UPI0033E8F42F